MATEVSARAPAERNVVVISEGPDEWLVGARRIVEGEEVAHDESTVERAMEKLLAARPTATAVELISHSDNQNLLRIGSWTVNKWAFTRASNQLKALLRGKAIHLVGCFTAVGPHALDTLRTLSGRLEARVLGTRGLVGHTDLDGNGAKGDFRASSFDDGQRPAPQVNKHASAAGVLASAAPVAVEDELLRGGPRLEITAERRDELLQGLSARARDRLDQVIDVLGPAGSYTFPGMLTEPSASEPLDGDSGLVGRIDELFGGQLVRIVRVRPRVEGESAPSVTEYMFRASRDQRGALRALLRG